jgi:hypothetical protein
MKALKSFVLAKSIAAAFVAMAGVAAPAISHASPDDGMVCRPGYASQFGGGNMKCTKNVIKHVALACANPLFPTKLIRTTGIPGDTTNGRDMCLRPGISLGSNVPATGLTAGQDFVFVTVNQSKVVLAREVAERAEEVGLGLGTDGVDSRSVGTLDINGGIGAEDRVKVDITLFTFPVAAPNITLPSQLLDRPAIDLLPPVRIQPRIQL